MLTCVYHAIDDFRVVEEDEAERLIASGSWFDSPVKAKEHRLKLEADIRDGQLTVKSRVNAKGNKNER